TNPPPRLARADAASAAATRTGATPRWWWQTDRGGQPKIATALEGLLQDATAGDPVTGLKWTHRSLRNLAKALRRRGLAVSANTVGRLLRDRGFSLRTCRTRLARARDPERGRQFRYVAGLRSPY